MEHPTPAPKPNRLRVQPFWEVLWFLFGFLALGICAILDVDIHGWEMPLFFKIVTIVMAVLSPFLIPRNVWGYGLDSRGFTIYFLIVPVRRVAWENVSQVVYVRKKSEKKGGDLRRYTFLCVTLKPAEPLPYFFYRELPKHWRRNLLLTWNIYFWNPETQGKRYKEAFETLWGPVETREYDPES